MIHKHAIWRADREAEGARLLSEYRTKSYLGFESPALRQYMQPAGHLMSGGFFIPSSHSPHNFRRRFPS
jgi:hypothetical protein